MKLLLVGLMLFTFNEVQASAMAVDQWGRSDCISCRGSNSWYQHNFGLYPPGNPGMMVTNQYMPWWYDYSRNYYPNYHQPAPWYNYGVQGSYYPNHGGGGMVGKPNLYIYGKKGTNFSIRLKGDEKSLLLAAVPGYENGWTGKLNDKGFVAEDSQYGYVYYDYSVDISKLQWTQGKCVKQNQLMGYLNKLLKLNNFKKNEIKDFNDYWPYKMPQADEYCVYPQGNKELDVVAKLEVTPKANINRLAFFVVPRNAIPLKQKITYFRKPSSEWKQVNVKNKDPIQINEWGVGFLDESFVKSLYQQ
jgi:hypothetical protein